MPQTRQTTPRATTPQDRLPTLVGERVVLRWLETADAPELLRIFGDPEVMRYWSREPFRDRRDAEKLVQEIREFFRSRTLLQWGIARRDDDRIIGTCTLHRLELAHRRVELGYALGRDSWGQGFMAEALGMLLELVFDGWGLHRVEADTDPRNERSLRVLERLGFRREGLLRERFLVHGEVQDSVFLGLLRPDWEHSRPRTAPAPGTRPVWHPFPSPPTLT